MHLQTVLSFDNNYFMDVVDGGLQCISMQNVKDLLESNYAYLSGVLLFSDHCNNCGYFQQYGTPNLSHACSFLLVLVLMFMLNSNSFAASNCRKCVKI